MKRLKLVLWVLFGVTASIALWSCGGEDLDGDRYDNLYLTVLDESGNNIVEDDHLTYKCTFWSNNTDEEYVGVFGLDGKTGQYTFWVPLGAVRIGEKVTHSFRMFPTDTEDITFYGTCIEYKGYKEMQWCFKDDVIPFKKYKKSGGLYSEVTLVRHDDGTYSLKE